NQPTSHDSGGNPVHMISGKLIYNNFAEVKAGIEKALDQTQRKIGFDIEAEAKNNTPVDTGALRASIYTASSENSRYGEALTAALGLNPEVEFHPQEAELTKLKVWILVGAAYGFFVHEP